MYHTTVSKKHSPEESQILTLITCRTIKKTGREIGSKAWDLADETSRLLDGHTFQCRSPVCAVSSSRLAFRRRGSCFWAISCIPPAGTPAPPKGLFSISWFFLPCCQQRCCCSSFCLSLSLPLKGLYLLTLKRPPGKKLVSNIFLVCSETFKLTRICRLLTTILHLQPRHCWPLFLASQKGKRSLRIE